MGKALRIIRITVQLLVFTLITWLLMAAPSAIWLCVSETIEHWQLIPMAMLGAMSVVGVWLLVTLVLGRIYCSTMCPIGTLQDIAARSRRLVTKNHRYRYKEGTSWMVKVAMITILFMAIAFSSLAVSWSIMPFLQVSPYNSYCNMVQSLDTIDMPLRIVISSTINALFVLAAGAFKGRDLCNCLCPVGSALGALNTLALFHYDIDTDLCTHCRRCEDVCKASCINSEIGTVDAQRCVNCFNCVAVCPDNAIRYTTRRKQLSIPMLQSVKPRLTVTNETNK